MCFTKKEENNGWNDGSFGIFEKNKNKKKNTCVQFSNFQDILQTQYSYQKQKKRELRAKDKLLH